MFDSSRGLVLFDHLRVPYRVTEDGSESTASGPSSRHRAGSRVHRLTPSGVGVGARLCWPEVADGAPLAELVPPRRMVRLGALTFPARLLPTGALRRELATAGIGHDWAVAEPVTDVAGHALGAVLRSPHGDVALPFDPDDVVLSCWGERFGPPGRSPVALARRSALLAYYRVRPLLPRRVQIALRRAYARVQVRSRFPAWPLEESLHGFYDAMLGYAAEVAGRAVPWIAPWPRGHEWALVLTHDVETADGVTLIPGLREVEERHGYMSSWNFVPRRYEVPRSVLARLGDEGCEIGIHGLYHDGRDLESARVLGERLPEMIRYAQEWGAVGFRSPATQRDPDLIGSLPFDYDSSYPDTDPFEPQRGGCCSWWPFVNGNVVELPITLVQDHTAFVILRRRDPGLWLDKADALRRRGGMALLITHPDYTPLGPVAEAYNALLARYAQDPTAWRALPREVASWWRRREASEVRPNGDNWVVAGPAAGEASVRLAVPASGPEVSRPIGREDGTARAALPQDAGTSRSTTPRYTRR